MFGNCIIDLKYIADPLKAVSDLIMPILIFFLQEAWISRLLTNPRHLNVNWIKKLRLQKRTQCEA